MSRRTPRTISNSNIDQYMNNTKINDAKINDAKIEKIKKIKKIKVLRQIQTAPPQQNESSPRVMNKLAELIQNPASKLGFGVDFSTKKRIESNEEPFKHIKDTNYIDKNRKTAQKRSTRDRFKRIARRMVAKQRADQQRADQIRADQIRADQIRELITHAPPNGRPLHQTSSARNPMFPLFPPKRQSKSNKKNKNPFANFKGGKTRKRRKKKN